MAQIPVRGLDEALVARLKERAKLTTALCAAPWC
jgi:hypothetical protein